MDHANKDFLKQKLSELSRAHICWFASRCALRALPVLAHQGEQFPFWKDKTGINVFAVFRSVNTVLSINRPNTIELQKAVENAVKAALNAAADAAVLGSSPYASAASYAAAYSARTAIADTTAVAVDAAIRAADAAARTVAAFTSDSAASAYAAAHAANVADLNFLKTDSDTSSWPELWPVESHENWLRLYDDLLKALRLHNFSYWADEYLNWVKGIFTAEKLERCVYMPVATIEAGAEAMLDYLHATELVQMAEARVVFLGEGEAGKTSLIRRLHGEQIQEGELATPRVEIRRRLETIGGDDIRVHYWDFGGQVIMHATHQFFMREKSVYVIVLDARRCDSLEYWLDHIRVFAADAPTFIVLNKVDSLPTYMETRPSFDISKISRHYPSLVDTVYLMSCKTSAGLDDFATALREKVAENLALRKDMPKQWFEVKEALAEENKDFIPRAKFDEICRSQGVQGNSIETALRVLDILGVAIHFPKLCHSDVVLNPEWITKAIYFIIWASEKKKLDGKLDDISLKALIDEGRKNKTLDVSIPDNKCSFLLDLMAEFKLAFKSRTEKGQYCVPMLTQTMEPPHNIAREGGLRFIFLLPFLPPGLFYRFIAESGNELDGKLIWRSGAILSHDGSKVLVDYSDYQRHIAFYAHGPDAGKYLTILRQRLMRMMGESYRELDYDPFIITSDGDRINWRDMLVRYGEEGNAKVYAGGNKYEIIRIIQEQFGGVLDKIEESLKSELRLMCEKILEKGGIVINFNNTNTNTVGPNFNVEQKPTITVSVSNDIQSILRIDGELKEIDRLIRLYKENNAQEAIKHKNELIQLQHEISCLREDFAEFKAKPESGPTAVAEKAQLVERIRERWDKLAEISKQCYYIIGFGEKIDKIANWVGTIDWDKLLN
jgi:small GTP-binding protein